MKLWGSSDEWNDSFLCLWKVQMVGCTIAEEVICDNDTNGILQFIEVRTSVHKTARAHHLRHMFLPVAAPAHGVTDDCLGFTVD